MKTLTMAGLGLLFAFFDLFSQDFPGSSYSKIDLQNMYVNFLINEGYKPEIDRDGDVVFKREGMSYFISVNEDDLKFFRIVLPNIWSIESERERMKVIVAANEANAKTKVAKVFTVKDNVWISTELFIPNPESFRQVFTRSLSAIDTAVKHFLSKMRE